MAKVRMIVGISGSRHDGQPWPPAGGDLECPDWEARDLIAGGNAVKAGDEPEAHVGETVPASAPPGTQGKGRVFEGKASAEEIMTGHPADPEAEARAAAGQHGLRGDEVPADAPHVSGIRENYRDPRPDSQIIAEDLTSEEAERIDLGKTTLARAKDGPAKARRKERELAERDHAGRRAPERQSALRYAAEGGITGAPGAEVPAGEPYPYAEGVRPASQVEAEEATGARNEAGEDVSEPGLEGMSETERAEFESRMPGYTAPAEIRDEPVPGQPTLEQVPGTAPGTSAMATGTGSKAGGKHRVTAESETPIEVSQEDKDVKPEQAEAAKDGGTELNDDAKAGGAAETAGNDDAPAPSAPKQEWVDYAVSKRGADVHEASAMTKADLMSRYGGRL